MRQKIRGDEATLGRIRWELFEKGDLKSEHTFFQIQTGKSQAYEKSEYVLHRRK